jgi:bacterioferritin
MEKAKSIHLLNQGVADELQAIQQYLYFCFHLDDQGFQPLAKLFKRIAIQEMGHLDKLAERVLFLKGDIEMVSQPEAILQKAMAMEEDGIKSYNASALECGENADSVSKQLFEGLVRDEEGHFSQFEKQHDSVQRFGLSYLALQSFSQETGTAGEV